MNNDWHQCSVILEKWRLGDWLSFQFIKMKEMHYFWHTWIWGPGFYLPLLKSSSTLMPVAKPQGASGRRPLQWSRWEMKLGPEWSGGTDRIAVKEVHPLEGITDRIWRVLRRKRKVSWITPHCWHEQLTGCRCYFLRSGVEEKQQLGERWHRFGSEHVGSEIPKRRCDAGNWNMTCSSEKSGLEVQCGSHQLCGWSLNNGQGWDSKVNSRERRHSLRNPNI